MHLNVVKSCLYALKWATWSLKRISHFQIPQGYIFYTTKEILNHSNTSSPIFYTSRKILRKSNHSNKINFTLNVPYKIKTPSKLSDKPLNAQNTQVKCF